MTKYIYYCLKAKQSDFHDLKHETGKQHVYMGDFENFSIPIVSMANQKKIVDDCTQEEQIIEEYHERTSDAENRLKKKMQAGWE